MSLYKGVACPYCQNAFQDADDIAVCPDCGAPHHRQCYLDHGSCYHENRHGDHFAWTPGNNPGGPAGVEPVKP